MSVNSLIQKLNQLLSEEQNPQTLDIDELSSLGIVQKINQQDQRVAESIKLILPHIAEAVDLIVEAFKQGGRLIYTGAGTSGRLGVLDAVECVPTFSVPAQQVVALIAGGQEAMFEAQEGVEDSPQCGQNDLKAIALNDKDIVVGIAASGRTPYVIGALDYAAKVGATRIALSCNPNAEIIQYAEVALLPIVGPEALTGSTRMKSGSAQKMVLNMLSTASMIRSGKSFQNLMVDLKASNEKLVARGTNMIMQITDCDQITAEKTLKQAKGQVKVAILMILNQLDFKAALDLLQANDGFLKQALHGDKR